MKKGMVIVCAALMTLAPMSASAAVRGLVAVGRPYYGGFYAPFRGRIGGRTGAGIGDHPNSGEVKLDTKVKAAQGFINGAYAGTTHEDKSMHLRPGGYNIQIKEGGQTAEGTEHGAAGRQANLSDR